MSRGVVARGVEQHFVSRNLGDAKARRAALAGAQNFAAAAKFEIFFGDENPSSVFSIIARRFACRLAERRFVEQHAEDFSRAAADAAAQLMQLRETEALGMFDDHDVGVRNVDADFDHGRGDENFELAGRESRHRLVFLLAREPPCRRPTLSPNTGADTRSVLRLRRDRLSRSFRSAGTPSRLARLPRVARGCDRSSRSSNSSGTAFVATGLRPAGFSVELRDIEIAVMGHQ